MNHEPTFIPDGYELDGFIRAVKGQHGAVNFKYRPLIVDERDEIRELIQTAKSKDYNPVIRGILAERIKDWDVKAANAGANDPAAPISIATIRGLHPMVFDKLYFIICGDRASDVPENASPKQEASFVDRFRANANGESTETAAVKN